MNVLALACSLAVIAAEPASPETAWIGVYDGHATEIAAGLALGAGGRFEYGLAYGALNEGAEGVWTLDGDRILLTSDPITEPEFRLVEQSAGPAGELVVAIELPSGLPVQLFDLDVLFASGERLDYGFREAEERVPFGAENPPVSIEVSLPVFDIRSRPLSLPAFEPRRGHALRFRFEPNDLGKVMFDETPLRIEEGVLVFERHGRSIRFRRVQP